MEPLGIQSNEVHLYFLEGISQAKMRIDATVMTKQEVERSHSYISAEARHEFVLARYALRRILATHFPAIAPRDFQFEFGKYGKPELLFPKSNLTFNLSHSKGRVVIAVSLGRRIGVDVEAIDRSGDLVGVAEYSFSALEYSELMKQEPSQFRRRFFQIWTLKEAYIKATGLGLNAPLDKFTFLFGPQSNLIGIQFSKPIEDIEHHWHFQLFENDPSAMVAIAAYKNPSEQIVVQPMTFPDVEKIRVA